MITSFTFRASLLTVVALIGVAALPARSGGTISTANAEIPVSIGNFTPAAASNHFVSASLLNTSDEGQNKSNWKDSNGDQRHDHDNDGDKDHGKQGGSDDHAPAPAPEPATWLSFGLALAIGAGALFLRRIPGVRK
jgi:hypothetical protein